MTKYERSTPSKKSKFKIHVAKMCACCERPKWKQWMVIAYKYGYDHCNYEMTYFEHHFAAMLFAFYIAKVGPHKVLQKAK